MKNKRRLRECVRLILSEFLSDFSMAGTRRIDAPGNIRSGQNVRGVRDSHLEINPVDQSIPQASVIYVRKGNKILAVSRGADLTDMNMPGGGVELGEDPQDAAIRELWEETGIIAHELVPIYTKDVGGRIIHAFKAISWGGNLRSSHEGKAEWVSPQTIRSSRHGDFFDEMIESLAGDFL